MEHELEKLVSRYQKAAERKQYWEPHWRECYEYAFPLRENVSSALYGSNEGERKNLCLYDGTAPDAVDQLASSLLAELTPPWAKWFGLRPGNELSPQEQEQVAPTLEKTSEVMLQNFEHSNFAVEIHQCYLDLVTAGTACLMFEEAPLGEATAFHFYAVPLREIAVEESADGKIDTTFRCSSLNWDGKRNMPASYDQYRINIPNELLDHDEELFKQFYEHGFTNDQAQFVYDLANERVIPVLDQLTISFEAQKQLAKLSSYFGGQERFDEVSRQISGWAKQNLRPEVYDALASTAEGVIALYKMMSSNEPMLGKEAGFEGELSEQSLRKMMEDPRYWRDKDTAYINKITKGFEKLYPGK